METLSWEQLVNENVALFPEGTALCIGSFDGPHRGHYEIFKNVLSFSKENGKKSGVVTFARPLTGIKESSSYKGDISTLSDRLSVFQDLGFDFCVVIDFSESFSHLDGSEFFSILKKSLNLSYVCEGTDFRCGYKGSFSRTDIEEWCKNNSVSCDFIELVLDDGKRISSTRIRDFLSEHNEKKAKSLLTPLP